MSPAAPLTEPKVPKQKRRKFIHLTKAKARSAKGLEEIRDRNLQLGVVCGGHTRQVYSFQKTPPRQTHYNVSSKGLYLRPQINERCMHSSQSPSLYSPHPRFPIHHSKVRLSSGMNPVYSPVQPGTAYANPKTMTYQGYPAGYPTTAPAYTPNIYQTGTPGYPPGYTTGTPYKVPPAQTSGAPPPYSASPSPYSTAMYPIRSAYPQQNLYAQGAYYSQPVFAQPHVIHHTTVVQPNSLQSAIYPAPVATARPNSVPVGMLNGSTMAMSAGPLLTTPQHTQHIGTHPVTVPTYRPQGYSYVPPHW